MAGLIPYLALLLQLGAAVALVVAGCAKLAEPSGIRAVIHALGVPWSSHASHVLAATELAAGLALILLPGNWVTSGLVIALALTFTAAAGFALWRRLQIDCSCFGSTLRAPLGLRQLLLAPIWAAVAVSVVAEPIALPGQRLTVALMVVSVVGMSALFKLMPLLFEHRTQRRITEGLQ